MPQSLALVLVHIIFSTKKRMAFLQSSELRWEVHAYLTGTLRALESEPLQVGGVADHVHILAALSRKTSVAEWVKKLKTSSTKIVKVKAIPISAGKAAMVLSRLANRPRKQSFLTLRARKSTIAK